MSLEGENYPCTFTPASKLFFLLFFVIIYCCFLSLFLIHLYFPEERKNYLCRLLKFVHVCIINRLFKVRCCQAIACIHNFICFY